MFLLKLERLWGNCPGRVVVVVELLLLLLLMLMLLKLRSRSMGYIRMSMGYIRMSIVLVLVLVLSAMLVRRLLLVSLLLVLLLLLAFARRWRRMVLTVIKRFMTMVSISLRAHRRGIWRSIRLLERRMSSLIEAFFTSLALRVTVQRRRLLVHHRLCRLLLLLLLCRLMLFVWEGFLHQACRG